MALQLWLPLNKDFRNVGLTRKTFSSSTVAIDSNFCGVFSATTGNGIYSSDDSYMANFINGKSFTLAVWAKTTADDTNLISLSYGLRLFGGSSAYVSLYNATGTTNCYSNTAISTNEWVHVAFAFDNATGTKKVYINGVDKTNTGGPNKTSTPSGIPTEVIVGESFTGKIEDYREYATCLSADAIKEIYNKGRK